MVSYTIVTALIANLLATAGDVSQTWTSPIYPKLYSNDTTVNPIGRPITHDEDSWIGSIINIGAVLGAIPAGLVADRIGRKWTLLFIALPHFTAYLMFALANEVYLFYLGRFINGIALGAGYTILPMYIAEVAEDSNRAPLSISLNIFWTFGNCLPYAIGPYLNITLFNLILAAIPLTFFVIFLLLGTESPYYLVHKGQNEKAKEVIIKLRSCSKDAATKEIFKIEEVFSRHENGSMLDIFTSKPLRKALIVSLTLMLFQQLSGITAMTYYLQPIFQESGARISADISSTICGVFMIIFSLVATYAIKKAGIKIPLAISCFGSFVSLGVLGLYFYIHDSTSISTDNIFWLPMVSVIGYFFFFNFALASVPWTISSELFPNNVKAVSAAAVTCCCWLSSFFVARYFNLLNDTLGRGGTFWIFSGASLLAFIFGIIWVPETRGKSFGEIQDMLQKRKA